MKKTTHIIIAIFVIMVCISAFSIIIFAEASTAENNSRYLISKPIAEPEIDIDAVIQNKLNPEALEENCKMMFNGQESVNYSVDLSKYLLEYNVLTDYWSLVTTFDYKGITDPLDPKYPTIYVPIFGDIKDTKGIVHNRVIGYFKLSYDPLLKKDYRISSGLYDCTSDDFKDKNSVWIYELITDYLTESKTEANQVFLIKYPNSLSEEREKIAVVQTESDTIILDISDSLHISDKITIDKATAYSVAEYRTLRMKIEPELYQKTSGGWENLQAGGEVANQSNGCTSSFSIPATLAVAVVTAGAIVTKRKKKDTDI